MTMHDEWTDQLSDYLDDELSAEERRRIESHLAECTACRRTLQDLQRIVATAQSLPPQPPRNDLWSGIASRISDTSLVAVDSRRRRVSFTLPELAAASILIAMISGGSVWLWTKAATPPPSVATAGPEAAPPVDSSASYSSVDVDVPPNADVLSTVTFGDAQYEAAVVDLEHALEAGRGRLDQATVAIVEQNLSIIDRAIGEARSALATDPSNGYLSSHLVEARRRKLELLRRTATLMAEAN